MKIVRSAVCVALCLSLGPLAGPECRAQEDDGLLEMVVGLLSDEDKEMRSVGLEQVRSGLKGREATERFAALLPKLTADARVGLLSALADRGDKVARPAVVDAISSEAGEPVRVAAINALGYLGETADTRLLVKLLSEASDAAAAARASLARLQGQDVPPAIVGEMRNAAPTVRVILIEVLTARRALGTIPDILSAAVGDEPLVRTAAMKALGQLADPEHIPAMVQGVLRAERGRERDAAEKAVMVVCARIEDVDRRAEPLLAVYEVLNEGDRKTLLPTLGRVGGPAVLSIVEAAIGGNDSQLHAVGIRALCNWPDACVAPLLIELADNDKHPAHRTWALRALIRVAPLRDTRSDAQRLDLLRKAMSMATRDAERHLVLDRARRILSLESLHFITPYLDQPRHAQQACLSVVELAHHRGVREPNKAEFDRALEKVIEISKDAVVIDRAHRYKKGQTWVRPAKPVVAAAPPQAASVSADETGQQEIAPPNSEQTSRIYPVWIIVAAASLLVIGLVVLLSVTTRTGRGA